MDVRDPPRAIFSPIQEGKPAVNTGVAQSILAGAPDSSAAIHKGEIPAQRKHLAKKIRAFEQRGLIFPVLENHSVSELTEIPE